MEVSSRGGERLWRLREGICLLFLDPLLSLRHHDWSTWSDCSVTSTPPFFKHFWAPIKNKLHRFCHDLKMQLILWLQTIFSSKLYFWDRTHPPIVHFLFIHSFSKNSHWTLIPCQIQYCKKETWWSGQETQFLPPECSVHWEAKEVKATFRNKAGAWGVGSGCERWPAIRKDFLSAWKVNWSWSGDRNVTACQGTTTKTLFYAQAQVHGMQAPELGLPTGSLRS